MKSPGLPSAASVLSRRHFIKSSAAAGFAAPFVFNSISAAPNSKLNHACIGVGGMGGVDFENFREHPGAQVVALCDVDANTLKGAGDKAPGARRYADWRELLEKEGDKIDSVTVSVPDHMHFPIALAAIQRGKHVYCQKPMCHDVAEVRALTEAAAANKVFTQLGTQAASSKRDLTAVQLLRSGAIGKVKAAYLCANRPGAVEAYRLKGPRPAESHTPPAHLNWDLWIGNAPMRAFAPGIYHPARWRAWQDFGTGWSGDIGCHLLDAVWKGVGMKAPSSVVAEVQDSWKASPERRADTWPQGVHITWVFPGNDLTAGKEWTVEWFDGDFYPPKEVQALYPGKAYPTECAMVVGTDGAMLIHGEVPILLPESKFSNLTMPKVPKRNHWRHFIDACLGGEKNESLFQVTGPMTEAVLLGTVAVRVPDQKLQWDATNMKFPNHPAAEKLLRRNYRQGWSVA